LISNPTALCGRIVNPKDMIVLVCDRFVR
jgi:hypothetical protein